MVSTRTIIWDEEVLQEIEEIADFYDERNGNNRYSNYLLNKFRETIKQAVSFPLSGKATGISSLTIYYCCSGIFPLLPLQR